MNDPSDAESAALNSFRQQIDSLDDQIVDLLAKRFQLIFKVAEEKKRLGVEIYQSDREREILERVVQRGADQGLNRLLLQALFLQIFAVSKRDQMIQANFMAPLRIGILDFENVNPSGYDRFGGNGVKADNAVRRLYEACKGLGHTPVVYKVEKCQLFFNNRSAAILYNNKKIKGCDVLIPRLDFCLGVDLEISIIKQFQLMKIPVVNEYLPIARAKNKLRTLQMLTRMKIPVPRTIVVRRFEYLDEAIKKVGGYPVILKSPFGTEGREVAIIESRRSMHSALDILWRQSDISIILIQEYVAEANGSDYRAFVVGDKVVASMKRTARKGDFRSNLSLGADAESVQLTEEESALAIRATKVLGLEVCGVDLLRSRNGPVVMEMNANPGLGGITKTTGVDVAAEMVKYAAGIALTHKKSNK